MQKIGRNDLCHCGSGKKYKNCHQSLDGKKGVNNTKLIIGGLALFIILLAISLYFTFTSSEEVAPAGKVWSEEHGHWHDAE